MKNRYIIVLLLIILIASEQLLFKDIEKQVDEEIKQEKKIYDLEKRSLADVINVGENYSLILHEEDTYEVLVFKGDNDIIYSNIFLGTQPFINEVYDKVYNKKYIQIFKGAGSGTNYSIFIDLEKELTSEALDIHDPAFIVKGRILTTDEINDFVYVIFKDIFDKTASSKKYILDNAVYFGNPDYDIVEAEMTEDMSILIEYRNSNYDTLYKKIAIDW